MSILHLNNFLLLEILYFLNIGDVFILNETCKIFYNLIKFKNIEKLKPPEIHDLVSNTKLIDWSKTHNSFKYNSKYTQFAIRRNKFKTLRYLYLDGCSFNKYAYSEAINNNNNKIIKWLHRRNISINSLSISAAAKTGNLKLLKWLKKKGNLSFNLKNSYAAALSGDISVLKYVIENGSSWDYVTYNYAVKSGNLDCLKYLYQQSFNDLSKPWWNVSTCMTAAFHGYLHILKFLRKKGCRWDARTTLYAFENKHIKLLDWAIKNKCPVYDYIYTELSNYNLFYNTNDVNIITA
jgi:hypothetical protein